MSSALSIKVRNGDISAEARTEMLKRVQRLRDEIFVILPVTASDFRAAAMLADRQVSGLRAGDALHLAVAQEYRAMLQTLNNRLAQAGMEAGIPTHLLT